MIYETVMSQRMSGNSIYFDTFVSLEAKPNLQVIEANTYWDDMVTFAQAGDRKMASWCVEPMINVNKFNKIWIFDKTKTKTYTAIDSANSLSTFEISSAEIDLLFQHGKLLNYYIYFQGKVVEICCATIHPSSDNKRLTPPAGYLIAAKVWSKEYKNYLSGLLNSDILIFPDKTTLSTRSNGLYRSFIKQLTNISSNNRSARIKVAKLFVPKNQSLTFTGNYFYKYLVFGFLFMLISLLIFSRWIIRPLQQLSKALKKRDIESIEFLKNENSDFREIGNLLQELLENKTVLNETETNYRMLFEKSPVGIILMDTEGNIKDINPILLKLLGSTSIQATMQINILTFPPLVEAGIAKNFKDCISLVKTVAFETPYISKWGKKTYLRYHLTPISDANNVVVRVLSIVEDVSENRTYEIALRESEEKFRKLSESTSAGIFITKGSNFIYTNPASEKITGYSSTELQQINYIDVIHYDFKKIAERRLQQRKSEFSSHEHFEIKLLKKTKEIAWVDLTITNIEYNGETAFLGTVYDITASKNAEQALIDSEKRYRLLFETASDLIFTFSSDGKIITVNNSFETITGWMSESIVHTQIDNILFLKDNESILTSNFCTAEVKMLHQNGTYLDIEISVTPLIINHEQIGKFGIGRDITQRKLTENALRNSEEMFRHLAENIDEAFILRNLNHQIIYANPAVDQILGTIDVVNQKSYFSKIEIIHPDDRPAIQQYIKDGVFASNQKFAHQFRIVTPANQIKWLWLRIIPIYDETCNIQSIAEFLTDISEQKFAEQKIVSQLKKINEQYSEILLMNEELEGHNQELKALADELNSSHKSLEATTQKLRKSEERFRSVYENLNIGIYRSTPDGKLVMANPALLKMFGYSSLIEMEEQDLNDKAYAQANQRDIFMLEIETKGEIIGFESIIWRRKDKTIHYVRENAKLIRKSDGTPMFYEGTMEDITEQKKIQIALKENEEKFRNIIHQSSDGITIIDKRGFIIEWNRAMELITGFKKESVLHQYIWDIDYKLLTADLTGSSDVLNLKSIFEKFLSIDNIEWKGNTEDYSIMTIDNEVKHIQVNLFPIRYNENILLCMFTRDVTENKLAEMSLIYAKNIADMALVELKEKREQLEVLNNDLEQKVKERTSQIEDANKKLAKLDKAKSDFLHLINHELRTPLNGIITLSEVLKESLESTEHNDLINLIKTSADTLFKLSETSLLITELQADNYKMTVKEIELNSFIKSLIPTLTKLHPSFMGFTLDIEPKQLNLITDSHLFHYLLLILLDNAIYHTKPNGMVKIVIRQNSNFLTIEITDKGNGFSDYILNNLFEFFITEDVKHKSRGLGLGLATAKLIMETLGGDIKISNTKSCNGQVTLSFNLQNRIS